MVAGSIARQRSTSSAPVTWPSVAARTLITARRCGVHRRPRSRRRWRTLSQGSGSDAGLDIGAYCTQGSLLQRVATTRPHTPSEVRMSQQLVALAGLGFLLGM